MAEMTPFPDPDLPWAHDVILRVEVGSTAHGTGLPGKEDYDELGIRRVPWDFYAGLPVTSPSDETIVYRPGRGQHDRSGPGDYDLVVYTARKAAHLMAQGNPSALMMLFGPVRFELWWGRRLRSDEMVGAFWSEQARPRFLGYAKAQRERLLGERGGGHGRRGGARRDELIAEHGYDTKFAMHMLRLGFQGVEYMSTGRIQLPMADAQREYLLAVRHGERPLEEVVKYAEQQEAMLARITSKAPERPDYHRINAWLREVETATG